VEKYGRARQTTDDKEYDAGKIHSAFWITKATKTHSDYVRLIDAYSNSGYANALQCSVYTYVIHVLEILLREAGWDGSCSSRPKSSLKSFRVDW
jgi:hypothetical protein